MITCAQSRVFIITCVQPRAFTCFQLRAFANIQPRAFTCVQPRAFTRVQPRAFMVTCVQPRVFMITCVHEFTNIHLQHSLTNHVRSPAFNYIHLRLSYSDVARSYPLLSSQRMEKEQATSDRLRVRMLRASPGEHLLKEPVESGYEIGRNGNTNLQHYTIVLNTEKKHKDVGAGTTFKAC